MESPFFPIEGALSETKAEVRRRIRLLLKTEQATLEWRSSALCNLVRTSQEWKGALTVGLFAPLPDEPNLLDLLRGEKKRFIFPRIAGESLSWHQVEDPVSLRSGSARGLPLLREPADSSMVRLDQADLLLVPGLAFTSAGARLGRGGGFYDRALATVVDRPTLIGVCFSFQVVPDISMESHDRWMQRVLSA